jgi:hypothetical protein
MSANYPNTSLSLQGIVLAYSETVHSGIIRGENGRNYVFDRDQWHAAEGLIRDGLPVTFTAAGARARDIVSGKRVRA